MPDDFLDDPPRRLVERIRSDVSGAAQWVSSKPPPDAGLPRC